MNVIKRVVSVSLGSRKGDFQREVEWGGQRLEISREGFDSDWEAAKRRIEELDGKIDAIGLGGIDIFLQVGSEKLVIGDGLRLAETAKITPIVDGSGLKNTLERQTIFELRDQGWITTSSNILLVSALDRFGMAEALVEIGCPCVFGDVIFNIGLDYPMTRLADVEQMAKKYRSRLLTAPFHTLYPTGSAQNKNLANPSYAKYYEAADIIAGDSHLILRHLPERIAGKGIICNTTRPYTVQRLREAGAAWIATTTPDLDGISAGTNLMEAALVAMLDRPLVDISASDYAQWIERLGWCATAHTLQ